MKLSELKKTAAPGLDKAPAAGSAPDTQEGVAQEPQGVTSVTPSGIEIEYQWAPRRLYRLRDPNNADGDDWFEVPSVTTVLGVLDRSGPLTWWSQGVSAAGIIELVARGDLLVVE